MKARPCFAAFVAAALVWACGGEPSAPLLTTPRAPMSATDAEDLLGARSTSKEEPGAGAAGVERATASGPSLLVQVRLIDGNFRAVAGGELVWLDTARPGARARVATDRAGAAFLAISTGELPREGLLAFAVSASGFSRELVSLEVAQVRGETSLNLGEIVLARGGSASGRIVEVILRQ